MSTSSSSSSSPDMMINTTPRTSLKKMKMKLNKNNKAQLSRTMLIVFVTSVLVLWQSFNILPQRYIVSISIYNNDDAVIISQNNNDNDNNKTSSSSSSDYSLSSSSSSSSSLHDKDGNNINITLSSSSTTSPIERTYSNATSSSDKDNNENENKNENESTALKSTLYPCTKNGLGKKACNCRLVTDVCIDHATGVGDNKPNNKKPIWKQLQQHKRQHVSSSSSLQHQQHCVNSSVPNHMIWTGFFTEMLGEFYIRTYTDLINLFVNLPEEQQLVSKNTTQLYIVSKKFLLSHETFLELFSNHDILSYDHLLKYGPTTIKAKAALHLPPPPTINNGNGNNNNNNNNSVNTSPRRIQHPPHQCTCLKRIYICSGSHLAEKKVDEKKQKQTLKDLSISEVQQYIQSIGSPTKRSIQNFRTQLIQSIVSSRKNNHNNNNHRTNSSSSVDGGDATDPIIITTDIDESEYTIIGLTQRSGRRRWLHLEELIEECNRRWSFHNQSKTVCVEINLETTGPIDTTESQKMWHASMDAIVGIHGAQLTHAVWMRPGSLVVEMLPWVMDGLTMGKWTKYVHTYTPLGAIFENTDLVHVGLPLDASSASHIECLEKSFTANSTEPTSFDCIKKNRKHGWDERDFSVPQDKLLHLLQRLVVDVNKMDGSSSSGSSSSSSSSLTCEDYKNRAGDDFVIYNVMCSVNDNDPSDNKTIHHFYRSQEWGDRKGNCTMCTYNKGRKKIVDNTTTTFSQ